MPSRSANDSSRSTTTSARRLVWALDSHPAGSDEQGRSEVAIRLCRELAQFWRHSGFVAEGQRFLERALARAAESGGSVGSDVVRCLTSLALLLLQGQSARALEIARDSVAMARRLGDADEVARALNTWAVAEDEFGDVASARAHLEETIVIARRLSDPTVLASALNDLSNLVSEVGDLQLSLTLLDEALVLNEERGNVWGALLARYNRACVIRELGETDAARQALLELVKPVLAYNNASLNIHLAEDLATVVGRGDDVRPRFDCWAPPRPPGRGWPCRSRARTSRASSNTSSCCVHDSTTTPGRTSSTEARRSCSRTRWLPSNRASGTSPPIAWCPPSRSRPGSPRGR